jgi:hypothetical protein
LGLTGARVELVAAAFFGGMVYVDVVVRSPEVGTNVGHLFSITIWNQKQDNTKLESINLHPKIVIPSE